MTVHNEFPRALMELSLLHRMRGGVACAGTSAETVNRAKAEVFEMLAKEIMSDGGWRFVEAARGLGGES